MRDNLSTIADSSDSACSDSAGGGRRLLERLLGQMGRLHLFPASLTPVAPISAEVAVVDFYRLRELFSRLDRDKADLDQVARDIEERFLAMGRCVQELCSLSNLLLSQSERLSNCAGTEFKTHLQGAFDVIRQQLRFVSQYQEINSGLITRLEQYLEKFERLSGCGDDLDRILTPMKTVCILFKIHSVSLGLEEKTFFDSLTEQIVELQVQARTKFREQMQILIATGQALGARIPGIKEQAVLQRQRATEKEAHIEQSMRTLQEQFEQMQVIHSRLSEAGQALKSASGGAVLGLQYQDITRQKWEHVAEVLTEMRTRTAPAATSVETATQLPHEELVFLRDAGRIQIHQLEAIRNDLSQSQSKVGTSVQAMLEQLRTMDQQCQHICGGGKGTMAVETMVKELLDTLGEVRVWVSELSGTIRETSNAVSSFDKTASDVSGTLRRLSANIAMTALNAQVQVARIGSENGLDVLSEFICTSATEIERFSGTVGKSLDELVGELHETILECHKIEEKTQEEERWLGEQGRQQEAQLNASRDATVSVQTEVHGSLEKIHEQATSTLTHSDFHKASHEGFERLQQTLRDGISLAENALGEEHAQATHHRVESLKQSYTMESERDVFHAAMTAAPARKTAPAEPLPVKKTEPAPTSISPSAPKSNIPVPAPTPISSPPPPAEPAKPEPVPVAAGASEAKNDFGDNVELF